MSGYRLDHRLAELRQAGFEVYWDTGGVMRSPLDLIGLTVLLWMIGMIMLGIASWRTGVLPKWAGGLITLGAFAFFIYQVSRSRRHYPCPASNRLSGYGRLFLAGFSGGRDEVVARGNGRCLTQTMLKEETIYAS